MTPPNKEKQRLDQLLVSRGLASSREKAQGLIMAGQVLVNDEPVEKSGASIAADAEIRIRGETSKFVGRGGDKLEGALEHFGVLADGLVALDVGASTGGFTDCLLQRGAVKVYAVDVGYNQLDERLRRDSRVVVMERTHAKDLVPGQFSPPPALVTIDVSFISARKVLEFVTTVLAPPFQILVLVKPQFEVGKELVGKGGTVKDEALQLETVEAVAEHARGLGLEVIGSVASALRGGKKGNQEYFLLLKK